ncbi:MAG: phytoene desaturase family protein [Planctomycetota bacterium]|nr:phytoene desaturase family protein [Planctomycetota bacterium]
MSQRKSQSVGVIGAGPGGLATAALLAASGLRVRVYEACPEIGGRTSRITLRDGERGGGAYCFDRGPTFFMMPYVLEEIFSAAGDSLASRVELTRLDPMYRLVHGSASGAVRTLDTTQRLPEMARRLEAMEPGAGASFERFMADNRRKLALMEPILRSPIRGVMDLMNWRTMKAGTVINPHQSVYQHLGKYFRTDAVKLSLSFQSKYLGMSPYECPSLFSILPFIEYEYGIWHPTGGCSALMGALAGLVEDLGGEVVTGAPVSRIAFNGRRATGVEVGGDRGGVFEHDHVVINADAAWAIKKLVPERLRPAELSDACIDAKRYSCSTFMLYLGLEGRTELPHHTIYISGSYKENIDDIAVRGVLSRDPSLYVCNPCVTDPGMAPAGGSALYVLVPTPNCKSGIDWEGEKPRLRRLALEQMERVLGLSGIEGRIRAERLVTPDDWRGSNINFGATFSMAHTLSQMLHKRPHHRLQGVDGVWLAGGGTHPGSGLPVIFLSAQITAKLLCAEAGAAYAGDRAGGAAAASSRRSEALAAAGA